MTDLEALYIYRMQEAEETLNEAEVMLAGQFSPRTIVNRAYYSMFYALLALFLKTGINLKTSKHAGVISIFDAEFVKTGKIDKRYSMFLHAGFDLRQEADYKDFVQISHEQARQSVSQASEFLICIKDVK